MSDQKEVTLGWSQQPLKNLFSRLINGGTPSTSVAEYWNGNIPWITGADFTSKGIGEIRRYVSQLGINSSSTSVVTEGNLLVVTRTGVGKLAICQEPTAISQDITGVCVDPEKADTLFMFYLLQRELEQLKKLNQGTSINGIVRSDLEEHVVLLPTRLSIQQKIARILQTVNQAIEKTEQLIGKYQQIKEGLMHDLFTRGIGTDGQLRPPREQAPELYQHTPIGWIPKEWQLVRCKDICTRISVGIVIQPTQYYVTDGVPAFRSANVREFGIDPTNFVYISSESNDLLVKSQIRTGDILTVRTGYPGTSAVVPPEFDGANCVDIIVSTPSAAVESNFLCDWVNSSFGKGQVLRQQGGMAQQHFNVGEMMELLVALPALDEQRSLSQRIDSSKKKISIEEEQLLKLQKQKSGLMHDLLTGTVPVSVDSASEVNA